MERSLIVVKKVKGFLYYLSFAENVGLVYTFKWNGLRNNAEVFPNNVATNFLEVLRLENPNDEYFTIPF